jgi:outer membrane protein OmpA-like peptidoglycan-associated protein
LAEDACSKCLERNQAGVSAQCKSAFAQVVALTARRAAARASVTRICDSDIKRLCAGIQPGDGNLIDCFLKVQRNVSAACRKAVDDAGYNVKLSAGPSTSQIQLDSGDLLDSLSGVESASPTLNARSLRQLALQSVKDPSRTNRVNRPPLSQELANHAQINIAIQFDFDKATIKPDSFAAVGLIADALYHPYLQGYCFLVIGHTDAKGGREYNLKLSQERADAVREALIKPFGIAPGRIEAVGLGEEQLLDAANPDAAKNRRVQLVNIGKLDANSHCPTR